MLSTLLETLAFTNLWVAAAAGALLVAAAQGLGVAPSGASVALAVTGTLVVYGVDRLRDLERDRAMTPRRSAFVSTHRDAMAGATALAAVSAIGIALVSGRETILLLVPVLAIGLLHRRIKHLALAKPAYISAAWLAVVVGVPAVQSPAASHGGWVAIVLAGAIVANAIASNVRDDEAAAAAWGSAVPLHIARTLAAGSVLLGALAPAPVRPLLAVPLVTLLVLVPFRPGERYGLIVVDGALLAGASAAIAIGSCS